MESSDIMRRKLWPDSTCGLGDELNARSVLEHYNADHRFLDRARCDDDTVVLKEQNAVSPERLGDAAAQLMGANQVDRFVIDSDALIE